MILTEAQELNQFGYPTDKGCDICGKKPAASEPRFCYVACLVHSRLSPIDFQNLKDQQNDLQNPKRED